MDLSQVTDLLHEQQKEMAAQRKLIEAQSNQIAKLKQEVSGLQSNKLISTTEVAPSTPPPQPDLTTRAEQDVETGKIVAAACQQTKRFSSNLLWTPTPRINIGLEYLWGVRENENGDDGDATQIQAAAQYNF
jgi:hypothetical protein